MSLAENRLMNFTCFSCELTLSYFGMILLLFRFTFFLKKDIITCGPNSSFMYMAVSIPVPLVRILSSLLIPFLISYSYISAPLMVYPRSADWDFTDFVCRHMTGLSITTK